MRALALSALLLLAACPSLEGFQVIPYVPPDSGVDEKTATCMKSSDCAGHARCVDGACVAPDPCRAIGPYDDDGATVFGILDAQQGLAGVAAHGQRTVAEKIIESWNASAPDLGASRFAALACDELTGEMDKFAQVKAPFVVGPSTASRGRSILPTNKRVLLSPYGDGIGITGPSAWFCANNRANTISAMQQAIDALAKKLGIATVKLLVVGIDIDDGIFRDAIEKNLVFNGQTPDGTNYLKSMLLVALDDDKDPAVLVEGAATLFKPDLVVLLGSLWAPAYIDVMELDGIHPTYLVYGSTPGIERLSSVASLAGRVFALDVDRDARIAENWARVRALLTETGVPEPWGTAQLADCLSIGMYAQTLAARTKPDVGLAIGTLTKGGLVGDMTREGMPQAMLYLRQNMLFELAGADLHYGFFGQATPTAAPLALQCIGASKTWSFAGLRWSATAQIQSGALACP
jgi:hypothetical protein